MSGTSMTNHGKSPLNNSDKSLRNNGARGRGWNMKTDLSNSKSMITKRFDYTTQQQLSASLVDTQKTKKKIFR